MTERQGTSTYLSSCLGKLSNFFRYERMLKVLPTNYCQLGVWASASSDLIRVYGIHVTFEWGTVLFIFWHKSKLHQRWTTAGNQSS